MSLAPASLMAATAPQRAQIAQGHGGRAGKGGAHGADEGEGGAKKDGALGTGEQQIDNGAKTCAEEGGSGAHAHGEAGVCHGIVDDSGDSQSSGHNGQQLLESENDALGEFGLVLDAEDELHVFLSFFSRGGVDGIKGPPAGRDRADETENRKKKNVPCLFDGYVIAFEAVLSGRFLPP